MRSFGLVTGHQVFEPQEFAELVCTIKDLTLCNPLSVLHNTYLDAFNKFDGHAPNGTNVIGILPGELWGTKDDQILIIGAHWDTVPNSDGMDDNGSGVAAVLEVSLRFITVVPTSNRTKALTI